MPATLVTHRRWYPRAIAVPLAISIAEIGYFLWAFVGSWADTIFLADYVSSWTAASLVRDGAGPALFDGEVQRAVQQGLRRQFALDPGLREAAYYTPFISPPPLALIFVPFTFLPFPAAYAAWFAISLLLIVVSVALPLRGARSGGLLAIVLLTFTAVLSTLLEGQVNSLFALALSLSMLALMSDRPFAGGLLLGLLWMKPQYAVLFPLLFLWKRRWRELAGMALTGALVALLSLLMVGADGIAMFFQVLSGIGGFHAPEESLASPHSMVNWRALLLNVWPEIPDTTGAVLVWLLGAATGSLAMLAWRGEWSPRSRRFPLQMTVAMLATLLAVPHSHFHGTVLVLPLVAMSLATFEKGSLPAHSWTVTLMAAYAVGLLALPFRTVSWMLVPCFLATIVVAAQYRGTSREVLPERAAPAGTASD